MQKKEKQVQIPEALYGAMVLYILGDKRDEKTFQYIKQGVYEKLDRQLAHEHYTRYKTAPTEQEKEEARQKYLEAAGIPDSYRWGKEKL